MAIKKIKGIKDISEDLYTIYPQMGDPDRIVKLVRNSALIAATAGGVGGIIPVLSIPAFLVSSVILVYNLYIKLCHIIGIKMRASFLRILARIAVTNIATNIVVLILGMIIPGASIAETAVLSYISIYVSAKIFLSMIYEIAQRKYDIENLTGPEVERVCKNIYEHYRKDKTLQDGILEAREDYSEHKNDKTDGPVIS